MATGARSYHDATKHTTESVWSSADRMIWRIMPVPFKHYPGLAPLLLPTGLPESTRTATDVLAGAVATPARPLDLGALAHLLFFTAGVTRRRRAGELTLWFRAYPCAGALYPVEVYVLTGGVDGLDTGVWHYSPVEHAVRRVRALDWPPGATAVALTGIPWRTAWKYGERGFRHLFWDAGTMTANLLALAGATGTAAHVHTRFDDGRVAALLDLGDPEEYPLALVAIGDAAAQLPALPDAVPLHLAVHPLSERTIDYPLIADAYAGGRDASRGPASLHPARDAHGPAITAPAGDGATIEEVILRRGSTRRFARDGTVASGLLDFALAAAARAVPGDFAAPGTTLLEHVVSVHAVDGVAPGAYRYDPATGALAAVHEGDVREATAHLCLDQPLGGDGSFTVFHLADLDAVTGALGDRGYRAALFEAGIAAGRLHLAAYALGTGASGLTFYDDDVSAFYATQSEPMLCVAAGVPGYTSRPGRRPSEMPRLRIDIVE